MRGKMSLSKNIRHYRRCVPVPTRHYSGGSNVVGTSHKMNSRTMPVTQWRILAQVREYLSKLTSDKTFHNALNKEFAHLLQKMQPSVYGTEIVRYFEHAMRKPEHKSELKAETVNTLAVHVEKDKPETNGATLPAVLNGLGLGITFLQNTQVAKQLVPKWKTENSVVSKSSIMCRTRQVISCITTAETQESKLRQIEELSSHIKQFPEAKSSAVKAGAIRLLLRVRSSTSDVEVKQSIGEALAILGYTDPVPRRGIRILSIDGGGTRGLLVIEMLKKLESLTGQRVHEMFDFICGVSTGAILACSLGILQKDVEQLKKNYKQLSTQIFTQSTFKGTSSLVWSHSYYDTALWERLLKQELGEEMLISTARNSKTPKIAVVSAVVNHERVSAYVFRNYSFPWRVRSQYMGSSNHQIWQAARASAAAPTYFEEYKLGNLLHQDGGILVNNPTAVAIHEAKLLWPETPIQCIVSFGTGRTIPNSTESVNDKNDVNVSSWKNKFMKILDSATDTEGVNTMLNDLLPDDVYYRFNPYLTEMLSMVEIDPNKMEQLERDALMYLRRNEDKFQRAAKSLLETRSSMQKALDWINLRKQMLSIGTERI